VSGTLARRTRAFEAVVSPYHLTTREPAAMGMLQLARRGVTLLLAPREEGADAARREAARSGVYRRYVESWAWAECLFREGLVETMDAGSDPVEAVREACVRLGEDPACAPLRAYLRPGLFEDDRAYLTLAAGDVLKAGPDPGVSLPIAAGLDAFAAERGMVVARSAPNSLAQQAEARLGRVVFRMSLPAVVQGSGERILLVRALLEGQRDRLARIVSEAFETGSPGELRAAAASYAAAFERERDHITAPPGPGEADEVRVVVGEISVVGMRLPGDAVVRSSLIATGRRPENPPAPGEVRAMVFKIIGARA
jgi:hypothetical protein